MGRRPFRRRSASRFRPRTHWLRGLNFNFSEVFTGTEVRDTGGAAIAFAHAVQLTGDEDLQTVGGEGAVIKRIVGSVKTLILQDGNGGVAENGADVRQSIQLLMIPDVAVSAFGILPQNVAAPLHNIEGLGQENILATRHWLQPRVVTASGVDIDDLSVASPLAAAAGGTIGTAFTAWFDRDVWDYDVTVPRRIEPNEHLWLITQWTSWFGTVIAGQDDVTYAGYLRLLAIKGR